MLIHDARLNFLGWCDGSLLLILLMLSPLKTRSVKRRLRYALSFLLIDVITGCLRDNSLMVHYL